jgi:ATP-binding cassette, subfamily F, member 3
VIVADLNNVARIFGGRTIFRGLSWSIQDGERIGLIGPSGGGKSTLVRILAGLDKPDEGTATFRKAARVEYLPQEFAGTAGRTALEEVVSGHAALGALNAELHAIEAKMAEEETLGNADAFDRVMGEHERLVGTYEALGGPMLQNRAEGLLRSLGLPGEAWARPMEQLSGGQRKIVGIARCLLAEPDLLLLDEPDNHLDLAHKAMLETVIREHAGAVVVVSHDRYLLDETVNVIIEVEPAREGARLKRWEGNYSVYVAQRELALLRQQQDYAAQQKEIARLEEAIVRFKVWASVVVDERHIKQARNKQRQIDRMEKVERPVLERRRMALSFRAAARGGAKAVELRDVSKAFGEHVVILGAEAAIMNGERVGIVGPNGSGKSVLLKLITGEHAPDEGEVWIGPSMRQGHYAQEHETLDFRKTPIEAIREVKPMYEGEAVAALTRFLLPYDTLNQPMAKLSGGEKSRVQLARLMLTGANLLLLDEPTNNLDIPAAEVLEEALEAFSGTVIVVSHDRYLLDRLVDRVIEVKEGEVRAFGGGYSYYAERAAADA